MSFLHSSHTPFYLEMVSYEESSKRSDPSERLTCFYFSILECLEIKKFSEAIKIYSYLLSVKDEILPKNNIFHEESVDILNDLIQSMNMIGFKTSIFDFVQDKDENR